MENQVSGGLLAHLGKPTELKAFGQTFRMGRLTLACWDVWFSWARTVLPDPLEVAHKAIVRLAKEEHGLRLQAAGAKGEDKALLLHLAETASQEQLYLTRLGMDKSACALSFDSPEIQSLLHSIRGQAELLYLTMAEYNPGLVRQDAFAILMAVGPAAAQKALDIAGGVLPGSPKNDEAAASTAA